MKKWLKWTLIVLLTLILLVAAFFVYVNSVFDREAGKYSREEYTIERTDSVTTRIGNNWLRREQPGLFTLYAEGAPFERGLIAGQLSRQLIYNQEKAFVSQLQRIIPSKGYLTFLKYVIAVFDLNLYRSIPEERKAEIYGISLSAADTFGFIATNYQRILNYHGAHDLGHMLSNLGMVGCTSFGVWGSRTPDGHLLIGRNFDFYVGDDFAREKMVAFIRPDSGYFHAFVTWGGMMGAVSGMNEKGLTVTINAANSDIALRAAMPVSLVARQILQYASTIDEAVAVAAKCDVFVSELFLIGSAADNKAVILEKRPGSQTLFDPGKDDIICTNHFQSGKYGFSEAAGNQKRNTASGYRYTRVLELLNQHKVLIVRDAVRILRDTLGTRNESIGLGNEKAINQLIAHHSIVFDPFHRKFWVSAGPHQLGAFVCYDLNKINAGGGRIPGMKSTVSEEAIPPDTAFLARAWPRYREYQTLREKLSVPGATDADARLLTRLNPDSYDAWEKAGDYYSSGKQSGKAAECYTRALGCELPGTKERERIASKLNSSRTKNKKTE
jgi:isopenicillin-N N-acyltransferase like protein